MGTAVMEKKTETKEAPANGAKQKELEKPFTVMAAADVALEDIKIVRNFRGHFDQKRLQELAENILSVGVLEPILLRKSEHLTAKYELIAGERRYRATEIALKMAQERHQKAANQHTAARVAALKTIPARILDVTREQAERIQALENLHRENLGPIEEARAFKTLMGNNYTAEDLGHQVNRGELYVTRAIRLLELPDEAIDAIEKGILTPAHGHQILRVPKDRRGQILKMALHQKTDWVGNEDAGESQRQVKLGVMTAKELQVHIDSEIGLKLSKSEFTKVEPYAGEVACSACPYNAANQGVLFDDAAEGRCLSKPCYEKKTEQVYIDLQAEGKATWPGLEFLGRGLQDLNYKRSIQGLPGNAMLSAEEQNHPVIKKLLAERPHKLGYAVVLPSEDRWDKERVWKKSRLILVVRDPALIGGMRSEKIVDCTKPERTERTTKKKTAAASSAAAQGPKPDPKRDFIDAQEELAVKRAAIETAGKNLRVVWRVLVQDLEGRSILPDLELLGLKSKSDLERKIEDAKTPDAELAKIAVALLMAELDHDDVAADIGVDLKKVQTAAREAAEKAWAARESADGGKKKG